MVDRIRVGTSTADRITVRPTEGRVVLDERVNPYQGPAGPQGPPGPPGQGLNYTHRQDTPSSEWVVHHNLGVRPAFSVEDETGEPIEAAYRHQDSNTLLIRFGVPIAGVAYLNG